ncbi:segregation/condensation protein A [Enterococcus gallinarum]|uniref:Segregation and condensation protein A n=1 Tax=Enterococcus gallinarum TaxID=1353 RepID=A0ABD4HP01_ENTGA|nr:segregation/condensation protein A [Enterococcus gallinarum]MBA0948803.1 segregation/condensation protein A [Enterococcus gallinarum]MBA0961807.1 segregation/condensation protein A [Enterococcus gallinarum]MBA0969752.1 segregation/condensation protein A [Enterococcus gallinarum]MBA0973102.1 segregation/condensation protein A [Enterococcus gallinarum]NVI95406.1 segregation/condensation protein A [Enterococcus gallinarum]
MEEINIKLDVFEGPLDLLLHLIQKLEIDVYDIPIAAITEQYMQYIHAMKSLELEVAGEYLVMAATLMAIKSQMLLPKQEILIEENDPYEEDPRDMLVAQLLEYRKYKYAAEQLSEKAEERSLYFTKDPMDVDAYKEKSDELAANRFNTIDLFLAIHKMLEKKKSRKVLETKITPDESTIDEKMATIQLEMQQRNAKKGRRFDSFFTNYSKTEVVTTFMALLELMKKGYIRVEQEGNYESILLYPAGKTDE